MCEPVIECQDCGTELRKLSPAEEQMVAKDPYNFIWFCQRCKDGREKIDLKWLV